MPRIALLLVSYYIVIWVGIIAGLITILFAFIPAYIINTRIYYKIMKYWSKKSRRPNALFTKLDEEEEILIEQP